MVGLPVLRRRALYSPSSLQSAGIWFILKFLEEDCEITLSSVTIIREPVSVYPIIDAARASVKSYTASVQLFPSVTSGSCPPIPVLICLTYSVYFPSLSYVSTLIVTSSPIEYSLISPVLILPRAVRIIRFRT